MPTTPDNQLCEFIATRYFSPRGVRLLDIGSHDLANYFWLVQRGFDVVMDQTVFGRLVRQARIRLVQLAHLRLQKGGDVGVRRDGRPARCRAIRPVGQHRPNETLGPVGA
mgnify:CR=1 FL=1